MPCLCTATTLRFFIRSVAQVDLPLATIRTSSRQWQKTAVRNFTKTHATHEPHSNLKSSDSTLISNQDIPLENSTPKTQESWLQRSVKGGDQHGGNQQFESPAGGAPKESTCGSRTRKDAPTVEIKPTIRRTGVENMGLAIHYSSPRAPLKEISAGSKSDIKSKTKYPHPTREKEEWSPPPREHWQLDKAALKEKFPKGWKPLKKLSPDALAGIRALHAQSPEQYTTETLAASFKISPEAIKRILKSKWTPDAEEETDRQRRWFNRGKDIYTRHAELGQKPPKKWRDLGIGKGKPEWMLRKQNEPLPALITTSRAKFSSRRERDSLEDRIL